MKSKLIFQTFYNKVVKLEQESFKTEKELQEFCEKYLRELLGITFLKTEFHFKDDDSSGRIDTLGIDGSNRPVIIEYKLTFSASIINQGLYYKKQLMKFKAEFMDLLPSQMTLSDIKFNQTRVICIAQEFDRFVEPSQHPDIEFISYELYSGMIIFNLLSKNKTAPPLQPASPTPSRPVRPPTVDTNQSREWFYFRQNGQNAQIRQDGDTFTVLKGSYISAINASSFVQGQSKVYKFRVKRMSSLQQSGDLLILDQDVSFPEAISGSQSRSGANQAAAFILGLGVNVWTHFKDKDGRTMDEVLRRKG